VSTLIPDLVVGSVGFGPGFGDRTTADLEAENSELIRRINRLKRALERCAALSEDVANEKHEALLEAAQRL
jgi:DNA-directed RNA polymerase beta' subunit